MTEFATSAYQPTEVSPPGETLREFLEERGLSQAELATRMGRPRKTISEVVSGKAAITHETALQLELVTGIPAEFWNARERKYRAYLAALDERHRLEQEAKWCARFPLNQMRKLGWIRGHSDKSGAVHELLSFLGVVSSEQWEELYSQYAVAFRRPQSFAPDSYSLGAWLRRGLIESLPIATEPFNRERFTSVLTEARGLTREAPHIFAPALTASCAAAGVAVVFVPELPKSRASGATRWLTPEKALIQLSLRYRTNDHLWFTFFHEAAHILLHGKKLIFIEVNSDGASNEEQEANQWAADFLTPRLEYDSLVASQAFDEQTVSEFAARIGIASGIVVGRLQHDGHIPHNKLNWLKERLTWGNEPETVAGGAA
jgi:HTH-type transcriptional regulator/antitoxin HigA